MALAAAFVVGALGPSASNARASEATNALAEAKAAITAQPPNREAARAALARAAAAKGDPIAVADAFLGLGRLDRDERAYTRALANYRACIAAAPDTIWARRASQQIEWLTQRSEGNFAPLDRFERVELDPALMSEPAALAALAQDADAFPPGRVRIEARMFVAEAWLGSPERRPDAIGELRKVFADIQSVDPLTARTVEREIVDALLAEKRIGDAVSEVQLHGALLDPPFGSYVRRLGRRRMLLRAAAAELVGFALLLAIVFRRSGKTRFSPAPRRWRKGPVALALGIGLSAASAALLIIDALQPTYLDRFGL